MVASYRLIARFESEKHLLAMLADVFCDKAYPSIRREAKAAASAPGMMRSQNGVIEW